MIFQFLVTDMKISLPLPLWTIAAPILTWLLFAGTKLGLVGVYLLLSPRD